MSYKEYKKIRNVQWIFRDPLLRDLLKSPNAFKVPAICGEYDEKLLVASFTSVKDATKFLESTETYFRENKIELSCYMKVVFEYFSGTHKCQIWIE